MIAVDTNVLVYAHRRESTFHDRARQRIDELASSGSAWAIPWPCVHEFYAVVTNERAFKPARPMDDSRAFGTLFRNSEDIVKRGARLPEVVRKPSR